MGGGGVGSYSLPSDAMLCVPAEESVEGSWLMRNDTLPTPQLTSTVLRENPRQAAEHIPDQDSEPGSETDYVHK